MPSGVRSILPFVPAKDFELSTQFYLDLGFSCPSKDEGVRAMKQGAFGFLLQDYYVKDWADNCMIAMHVDDADAWWKRIQDSGVLEKYEGVWGKPPKLKDWGMIVAHVTDPTGVLWHITQNP